jgi:hypothetical protein
MDAVEPAFTFVRGISHEISNLLPVETAEARIAQRRAVTRRASTILAPEVPFRRQGAASSGQTCVEQFTAATLTSSRSALASTAVSLASTAGAKPGKAITDAPSRANIKKAERDLTIWRLLTFQGNPAALGDR